jgi:hypothetical protein
MREPALFHEHLAGDDRVARLGAVAQQQAGNGIQNSAGVPQIVDRKGGAVRLVAHAQLTQVILSRPSARAPPRVATASMSRTPQASAPSRRRCSSRACRASASRCPLSFEDDPSTPSATGTPAPSIASPAPRPRPGACWSTGQCATAGTGIGKAAGSRRRRAARSARARRRLPASPDASAYSPGVSRIRRGCRRCPRVLRQVRVQAHTVPARELRRVAHQFATDGERRTGCQGHLQARRRARIVPGAMRRSLSARIAASSSTRESGGSPPADSPTLMLPRSAWKRIPVARRLDRIVEAAAVRKNILVVRRLCSRTGAVRPGRPAPIRERPRASVAPTRDTGHAARRTGLRPAPPEAGA